MELTRRDALAALSAAGVAVGGGGAVMLAADDGEEGGDTASGPFGDEELATLVAAGEVLYPDAVEGVESFVTRYAEGRARDRPDHAAGTAEAVAYLDDYCRSWFDAEFAALDAATRESALRRMNADTVEPDPDGSDTQRVRYYVVNELLYALYSSPTGGKLVGIENPQGHPGGTTSYQRGPGQ
ncbi:gluconate 2-dehydrogenase subunit 3 family protein [Haloarcula nitratireducens]|uniref:Gluconate 2-dehydrogenase subunit 3 family protein n=1 Tax=Haloarcula nitratireducens TaxID=2487749 RepID=A0AAW4P902_9EURY|nr:gluconate 2-dehydrogenase subunit 3 family protein [Halomicroarcula nitratireducens]MBX0294145.1 gluconate 2-dehydrogenase subunit 3 family protein [Halomicroarcula nitratireducens]